MARKAGEIPSEEVKEEVEETSVEAPKEKRYREEGDLLIPEE